MGLGEDGDIIQVDENESSSTCPSAHLSPKPVGETKGHHQIFIMPSGDVEGGLPLITLPDLHPMKGIAEIE